VWGLEERRSTTFAEKVLKGKKARPRSADTIPAGYELRQEGERGYPEKELERPLTTKERNQSMEKEIEGKKMGERRAGHIFASL